jgi:hypothetical protein
MPKRPIAWVLLAGAGFLAHHAAQADVFRCTGPGGKTLFTDQPCPGGMKTTDVTASVQVCGTVDCLARREHAQREAEARRRAEREALVAMMEERHRLAQEAAWLDAMRLQAAALAPPVRPPEYFEPVHAVGAAPLWRPRVVHHRQHRPPPAAKPVPRCIDERCVTGLRGRI